MTTFRLGGMNESGRSALLMTDGSRKFSDAEHERRHAELLATLDMTVTATIAAAEAEGVAVAAAVTAREGKDLAASLATGELTRANALAAFVKDDVERMPSRA